MALSREAILARAKPGVRAVHVPGWDGDVFLRDITIGERNRWAEIRYRALDGEKLDFGLMVESRIYLVSVSLCDEDGKPLFSMEEVAGLDSDSVDFLANEAEKLNGLTQEAQEEVKGNSPAPQDG